MYLRATLDCRGLRWTQVDDRQAKTPVFRWGFDYFVRFPRTLSEELMAVDAVCRELVSAWNSLVSGNVAGNLRIRAP